MHLLAREEIGLRCLLRVAQVARLAGEPVGERAPGPCSIAQIAQAEGLSVEYAAKLMRRLRQGGLVESVRGAAGGYRLAREAHQITVWEAVQVLDESFLPQSPCDCDPASRGSCRRTAQCAVQSLWCQVGDGVRDTLSNVTLAQLCPSPGESTEEHTETRTLPVVSPLSTTTAIASE